MWPRLATLEKYGDLCVEKRRLYASVLVFVDIQIIGIRDIRRDCRGRGLSVGLAQTATRCALIALQQVLTEILSVCLVILAVKIQVKFK